MMVTKVLNFDYNLLDLSGSSYLDNFVSEDTNGPLPAQFPGL